MIVNLSIDKVTPNYNTNKFSLTIVSVFDII